MCPTPPQTDARPHASDNKPWTAAPTLPCALVLRPRVLVFETGERFEERNVWHGPMQSKDYYHWNEEILPVPESDKPFCKYAVVAYAHEGSRLMQRRPQTRLGRFWKALRRLRDGCKRRYHKWQSVEKP